MKQIYLYNLICARTFIYSGLILNVYYWHFRLTACQIIF